MIDFFIGSLASLEETSLVIDVRGVGYRLLCSRKTAHALGPFLASDLALPHAADFHHNPKAAPSVKIWVQSIVREGACDYFGFFDKTERSCFDLLRSVPALGPRIALNILSALTPSDLALALRARESSTLTRADGVGPKLAKRLIAELSEKPQLLLFLASPADDLQAVSPLSSSFSELTEALQSLGYTPLEIERAQARMGDIQGFPLEDLIPRALAALGGHDKT